MHLNMKYYLAGLAALALTIPVWAHTNKQTLVLATNKTIGNAQLKPGSYELSADDTQKELSVLQKGKIVATVQGQWVKIPQKADDSAIDSTGDKITQVEFSGSDQAFQPI